MKAKLIHIGNSRGVRLPKPLITEARLDDEVDIQVRDGSIIISSMKPPRIGWEESARLIHDRNTDSLLDPPNQTKFEQSEWEW
jgi:antitoxin MazE